MAVMQVHVLVLVLVLKKCKWAALGKTKLAFYIHFSLL